MNWVGWSIAVEVAAKILHSERIIEAERKCTLQWVGAKDKWSQNGPTVTEHSLPREEEREKAA